MGRHGVYSVLIGLGLVSAFVVGLGCELSPAATRNDITAVQLQQMLGDGSPLLLLDVRTAEEFAAGHIEGALNRPVGDVETWSSTLVAGARTATICQAGSRSRQAADALIARGFTNVYNVTDGMAEWPGATVTGAE